MHESLRNALLLLNENEIIKLLKEGQDPNQEHEGKHFVFHIIRFNLVKVFDHLMEKHSDLFQKKFKGQSCLEYAIYTEAKKDITLKLINLDVNVQNIQGKTPLHLLIDFYDGGHNETLSNEEQEDYVQFLKKIFSFSPNLDLKDNNGNTVKKKIEGNQLASIAYKKYHNDRYQCLETMKTYLSVPQSKISPRELTLKTLAYMVPSYVPDYQRQRYVVNLNLVGLELSNQPLVHPVPKPVKY